MASDDLPEDVKRLPVRFKNPLPEDRTLLLAWEAGQYSGCFHTSFIVDSQRAEVECAQCHEKLNPMWVLEHLAVKDLQFKEAAHRYREEMRRLAERSRTKCQNCGHMTRISRR